VTIGAHLLILVALISAVPRTRMLQDPDTIAVSLVRLPPVEPPPPPPEKRPTPTKTVARAKSPPHPAPRAEPAKATAAPPRKARRAPEPDALPASEVQSVDAPLELSDSQLAGAITAGAGAGGGDGDGGVGGGRHCDMVQRLQNALRRDYRVQAAIAEARHAPGARGGALVLWNGDWIRNPGEDGKGLASVRQAIIMEVGFAPEDCRRQPVHGIVLLSMNDAPGSARVVLGSGVWRWSDLLFAR
jgi:hypothetical protein